MGAVICPREEKRRGPTPHATATAAAQSGTGESGGSRMGRAILSEQGSVGRGNRNWSPSAHADATGAALPRAETGIDEVAGPCRLATSHAARHCQQ